MSVIDLRVAGDLSSQNDHPCLHQRFTGDARRRVGAEDGIEDGIGDVVCHLVGVSRADGFGREHELPGHGMSSLQVLELGGEVLNWGGLTGR